MSEEPTTPDLGVRVRGLLDAASRREWDVTLRSWAPGAVWDGPHQGVGKFEGVAAIRGLWTDWTGAYEHWGIEIEEILDLGNGVVVALVLQGGRPVHSVGHVQEHDAWVYEWTDGMVVRVTAYSDQDEGRSAAERLAQERG
jgi:ketosteroid isomerase-like protein